MSHADICCMRLGHGSIMQLWQGCEIIYPAQVLAEKDEQARLERASKDEQALQERAHKDEQARMEREAKDAQARLEREATQREHLKFLASALRATQPEQVNKVSKHSAAVL